jgi:hypothetical protein
MDEVFASICTAIDKLKWELIKEKGEI